MLVTYGHARRPDGSLVVLRRVSYVDNKPHVNTPIVHDQREAQEAIHDDRAKGFNARATMQCLSRVGTMVFKPEVISGKSRRGQRRLRLLETQTQRQ
ncbi:hypothetical protein HYQ45_010651 [Verticillium longisporum]|uniref:Uncharacterized protein n=1 Tax=Verticillium longisporum TaxID=100787 RepID=A0A8I3ALZ0_VERLO|nr:hypothetical protein HYQ45_010651 [Verticillium longisporum]